MLSNSALSDFALQEALARCPYYRAEAHVGEVVQAGEAPGAGEVGGPGRRLHRVQAAAVPAPGAHRRQLAGPGQAPVVLQPVRLRMLLLLVVLVLLQSAVRLVLLVVLMGLRQMVRRRRRAGIAECYATAGKWAHRRRLRSSVRTVHTGRNLEFPHI